jgi:transaldolase
LADGISINVTLIFSIERYKAVLESFLSGLERRKAAGGKLAGIESVASFFISRVDTETDRRLSEIEDKGGRDGVAAHRLRGQAAIANARLAYQVYEDMLESPRWQALAASGARPQRLLWASTGVKDKAFSDTRYVVDLVAPDTVNTMPAATLRAVADHGVVRGGTIRTGYEAAWDTLDELGRLGIDMADVADTLEREGVATFVKSWNELIGSVTEKLKNQGPK